MDSASGNITKQDRALIDRITYLASLTSESKVIDPMLDPLRRVTADWDNTQPLRDIDRAQLHDLELRIKDFLINSDPLRSFSAEDLEDRIRLRETSKTAFSKYLVAVAASFVIAGCIYLVPSQLTTEYKTLIAACVQMLVAQIITVGFYLANLNNFKREFRRAFAYISIGIFPLGIFFAQIGLVEIIGIGNNTPFIYAGMSYLATIAFAIMYFGFREYARLLEIESKLTSAVTVFATVIFVAGLATLIPHASHPRSLLFFNISFASIIGIFLLATINATLIRKIMHSVTSAYRKPMFILYIYMFASIFGAAVADIALYLLGELNAGNLTIVILLAAIPQQLLLLYSGYRFDKYIGH